MIIFKQKINRKILLDTLLSIEYEFENKTHKISEQKEYLEFHLDRYLFTLKILEKFLKPGMKILDLGAFPFHLGILLKIFLNCDIVLNGLPFNLTSYEKTSRENIIFYYNEKEFFIEYFNFNLEKEKYPFEDNSFDLILSFEVIEHLTENPVFMLNEINRVLRPEAPFILTTDNATRLSQFFKLFFNENIWFKYYPGNIYFRHNREFILKEIKELLSRNGFKIEKIKYVNINMGNLPWKRFLNILFNIFTSIPLPFFYKKKRHILSISKKQKPQKFYPKSIFIREPGDES